MVESNSQASHPLTTEDDMSDFIYQQQSDELVDGQYYMGEYQPTEQDLADMNEAWGNFDDADALASAGWGTDEDYE